MKTNMQRLSFLLALLSLGSTLLSCGDTTKTPAQTNNAVTSPSTEAITEAQTSEEDMRRAVSDGVPELNFDGAEFRTITQDSTVNDIWVDGESGDVLDDAIYSRNRAIEERFNITIPEAIAVSYGDISSYVKKIVSAGDDAYDLVIGQMEQTGQDALGGYFMNWYDLPYLDFTKPWFPSTLVEETTVNDKMFIIASDLSLSYVLYTYCIYYDKAKAADYDLPDLYTLVDEGKWTIDQLFNLTKDIYVDLDGSNDPSDGDYYGMYAALDGCTVGAYFYGIDQPYVSIKDGNISMDINTSKTASALEKFRSGFFDTQGVRSVTSSVTTYGAATEFVKGNYLFSPSIIKYALYDLRNMKSEYGILPFPKWDEAQTRYYSAIDAGSSVLTVPTTAQNTEMIGAVVQALSAESWKSVMPTFYDTVMDSKIANDEGTVRMLDTIFDSRVIDFAYIYDGWNGWVFKVNSLLTGNQDLASFIAQNEKAVTRHYKKVLDIFYNES